MLYSLYPTTSSPTHSWLLYLKKEARKYHPFIQIKESGIKLIDALASEYAGRSYIIENEKLLTLVIQILKNEVTSC